MSDRHRAIEDDWARFLAAKTPVHPQRPRQPQPSRATEQTFPTALIWPWPVEIDQGLIPRDRALIEALRQKEKGLLPR